MSQGKRTQPMLVLVAIFGLLPIAFLFLVFLPLKHRMTADQARLEAAIQRNQALPNIQPLTSQERGLLDDPSASWRTRIPLVASDAQRLAHYHRVITELQQEMKVGHAVLLGVRSTWNPIEGSYTLPLSLGPLGATEPLEGSQGAGHLQPWVLEASVGGSPAELFRALEALPRVNPLLEPVALRWEMDAPQPKQMMILRNLVTIP
jgi:hypothetical protein